MELSAQTVIIGALTGLTYAVLAAGLVLVYRATKVINFAHGQIGAFGAAVLAKLVLDKHWNFLAALVLVLVIGGAVGAAVELGVVRRLFKAPRVMLFVATLGVTQIMLVAQFLLPGVRTTARYPTPLHMSVNVGGVRLESAHLMVIFIAPVVIVALGIFLNRTWFGLAIRASAENADQSELSGISTKRVSTLVWVLAGVLATLTAVLLNPVRGTIVGLPSQALGPGLLLRALAAGLIGGLTSFPLALAGGVAIGVVEAILVVNVSTPGVVDVALFALILILVLSRGRDDIERSTSSWSLTAKVAPIPERLRQLWWVAHLGKVAAGAGLAVGVLLPIVFTGSSRNFLFSNVLIMALIGLSVTVLTGWAGQLSLGQYAFTALGAVTATALVNRGFTFPISVSYAVVAGAVAAVLVGFPALRVQGLFLAVTTLAFAIAMQGWVLRLHVFTGGSSVYHLPRTEIFGFLDLRSQRTYYVLCLVVLVTAASGVARLRRSGVGRSIIAVRDNEAAAASFGISPAVGKLAAFAFAGALAALAGALLAGAQVFYGIDNANGVPPFGPEQSLQVVAMTVIGGLGSVSGALLGAVYVVGLPALFNHNATVGFATSGVGLLVLLLYLPGGLAGVVARIRNVLLGFAERRLPATEGAAPNAGVAVRELPTRNYVWSGPTADGDVAGAGGAHALQVTDITMAFGGLLALDRVSLHAEPGEIVGLIGSNGAGKSTLMNVVGGLLTPASGSIQLWDSDITDLPAHRRARLGMGRVFQDARLFADLTVRETVQIALETHERSEFVPSLFGYPPARRAERRKGREAAQYIDFLGLGRYADTFLSDLSTGTRRIVEMCCLLAQGSRLLLLDEPTAGVAQRETEAFAPLIRRIQAELDATIVIIEHDMPLVMAISDRIYCLAVGVVSAEGPPQAVRTDAKVIGAYLGTDERAIARSDTAAAPGRTRRRNGAPTATIGARQK